MDYAAPGVKARRHARVWPALVVFAVSFLASPVGLIARGPYSGLRMPRPWGLIVESAAAVLVFALCVAVYQPVRRSRPHAGRAILFVALLVSGLSVVCYIGLVMLRLISGRFWP